jgi:hypothetical protein
MPAEGDAKARQLAGLKPFRPGVSANPGGRPRQVQAYRKAIQNQETPEHVCAVVESMRVRAISGEDDKGAAACARVYFEAVGLPLGKPDDDLAELMRDAPPEALDFYEKLKSRN